MLFVRGKRFLHNAYMVLRKENIRLIYMRNIMASLYQLLIFLKLKYFSSSNKNYSL